LKAFEVDCEVTNNFAFSFTEIFSSISSPEINPPPYPKT
jgi:hypothetical protein